MKVLLILAIYVSGGHFEPKTSNGQFEAGLIWQLPLYTYSYQPRYFIDRVNRGLQALMVDKVIDAMKRLNKEKQSWEADKINVKAWQDSATQIIDQVKKQLEAVKSVKFEIPGLSKDQCIIQPLKPCAKCLSHHCKNYAESQCRFDLSQGTIQHHLQNLLMESVEETEPTGNYFRKLAESVKEKAEYLMKKAGNFTDILLDDYLQPRSKRGVTPEKQKNWSISCINFGIDCPSAKVDGSPSILDNESPDLQFSESSKLKGPECRELQRSYSSCLVYAHKCVQACSNLHVSNICPEWQKKKENSEAAAAEPTHRLQLVKKILDGAAKAVKGAKDALLTKIQSTIRDIGWAALFASSGRFDKVFDVKVTGIKYDTNTELEQLKGMYTDTTIALQLSNHSNHNFGNFLFTDYVDPNSESEMIEITWKYLESLNLRDILYGSDFLHILDEFV